MLYAVFYDVVDSSPHPCKFVTEQASGDEL